MLGTPYSYGSRILIVLDYRYGTCLAFGYDCRISKHSVNVTCLLLVFFVSLINPSLYLFAVLTAPFPPASIRCISIYPLPIYLSLPSICCYVIFPSCLGSSSPSPSSSLYLYIQCSFLGTFSIASYDVLAISESCLLYPFLNLSPTFTVPLILALLILCFYNM